MAAQHDVDGIRWWPPTAAPTSHPVKSAPRHRDFTGAPGWADFVVETVPASLPAFRADLERALGCRVAIYLADQLAGDAWQRIGPQTVAV